MLDDPSAVPDFVAHGHLDIVPIVGVFIPIVAIVMGLGIGMLKLYLDYRKKRELIQLHVAETGSVWGEEILNDLRSFIGHFWLVKPKAASIDSLIEDLRRAA